MIRVTGYASLQVPFNIVVDMTEEAFNDLTPEEQDNVVKEAVDWKDACRSAEIDDIDPLNVEEIA